MVSSSFSVALNHSWTDIIPGDIVHLSLLGQPIIILGSAKHAVALLEKSSAIYSDRPYLTMCGELVGWDATLALTPYGERFRKHRKWLQDVFVSKQKLATYCPIQRRETYTLLSGLCEAPELFMDHIKRYVRYPQ